MEQALRAKEPKILLESPIEFDVLWACAVIYNVAMHTLNNFADQCISLGLKLCSFERE